MTDIAFLRPYGFLFLIPALLFFFYKTSARRTWFKAVDPHLIDSVTVRKKSSPLRYFANLILFLACVAPVFAFVGVAFRKTNASLFEPMSPVIIVMDISLSMRVNDVAPNRLSKAVFKTYDLLKNLKSVPKGLVLFSDQPYGVIPATTDNAVIESVLPLISFNLMPSQGTRIDRALEEARQMISDSGASTGDIFLITDGGENAFEYDDKALNIAKSLAKSNKRLFVLGVGTTRGGPLTDIDGKPIYNRLGQPVIHTLKEPFLKSLAVAGNGAYASVSSNDDDIDFLLKAYRRTFEEYRKSVELQQKTPADEGYLFLILPALLFPLLFRSGKLAVIMMLLCSPAKAGFTENWFYNDSKKAAVLIEKSNMDEALRLAEKSTDFTAVYNVGTAFLLAGEYEKAVAVLTRAVALDPRDVDAEVNLEIAKKLLEKDPPPPPESPPTENPPTENPSPETNSDSGQDQGGGSGEDDKNDSNDPEQNPPPPPDKQDNQNGDGGESSQDDSSGSENQNGGGSGNGGSGGGSDNSPSDSGPSDGGDNDGKGNAMPRAADDPLMLLKRKILFIYRSGRYPEEALKGPEW